MFSPHPGFASGTPGLDEGDLDGAGDGLGADGLSHRGDGPLRGGVEPAWKGDSASERAGRTQPPTSGRGRHCPEGSGTASPARRPSCRGACRQES